MAIDAETAALLAYADQCHRLSGGRFDVTSGVLRRAWNFRRSPPCLPDAASLAVLCALVAWQEVEWDERSIRLPRSGMEIDFGGIGKEYAADRAAAILAERGVRHALVNLGGDVRALGGQADGTPWRVGVRHPRATDARAAIASVARSADGAVATSGDYERYIEVDGRRDRHLLDPRTGWPVRAWQSISVVAPLAVVAGSVATIAMLLADEAAPEFLASQGLPWLASTGRAKSAARWAIRARKVGSDSTFHANPASRRLSARGKSSLTLLSGAKENARQEMAGARYVRGESSSPSHPRRVRLVRGAEPHALGTEALGDPALAHHFDAHRGVGGVAVVGAPLWPLL